MGSQGTRGPIRLAILMTDVPLPGTCARYTDYAGVFTDMFARAVAPAPLSDFLTVTKHDVVSAAGAASYPRLGDVDAVLITGSRHDSFADDPWILELVEWTRAAVAGSSVRVVGVCFGHQIVARALGVRVDRNPGGWELAVTEVRLSDEGRKLFGLDKMVSRSTEQEATKELDARANLRTQRIHQMHRDAVFSYPAGAVPLADTDVCPVQGMLIPGKVITVQGHPEFTEGIVREILESRHDSKIISDELYMSGIDRVANEHDGLTIARAFLKFMRE